MVWLKLIGHAQTRMQENNLVWSKLTRPDVLELIVSDWNLSPNCNLSELNKHETYFFKGEENVCKKKKRFRSHIWSCIKIRDWYLDLTKLTWTSDSLLDCDPKQWYKINPKSKLIDPTQNRNRPWIDLTWNDPIPKSTRTEVTGVIFIRNESNPNRITITFESTQIRFNSKI